MQSFLQCLKEIYFIFIIILFTLSACEKNKVSLQKQTASTDYLAFEYYFDNTIRINQAITVYDSTQIRDSIDWVHPPSDKYYDWHVIPDNGCDSIMGDKNKGLVHFIFHCSGTYLITANIYDSLTHNLIGKADTVAITVTTDTLHAIQSIKPNDTLTLQWNIGGDRTGNDTSVPYTYFVYFLLESSESYVGYDPYTKFNITSDSTGNSYTYSFSNIVLTSYPFVPGAYGTMQKVEGEIQLPSMPFGVPTTFTIQWLGQKYTGTVTLSDKRTCLIDWNNSGAVKLIY